jgi:hypothetical protein
MNPRDLVRLRWLVSVGPEGKPICSSQLSQEALPSLKDKSSFPFANLMPKHHANLVWHRERILVR